MIISHKYKFIFLKTAKTAGTSIEIALSKFCGTNDIITPISPADEEIRKKLGYPGPQCFALPIKGRSAGGTPKTALQEERIFRFYNHISAKQVKAYIGKEVWDSYYRFCFERNPWDRVISLYYGLYSSKPRHYGLYSSKPRPALSEFIHSEAPLALRKRGYELYTIDGKIAVNNVCRFENISEELEAIRKQIGIPETLALPRAKSGFRKDKRPYQDILTDADRVRIAQLFHDEISLFGYEFHADGQRHWSSPSVRFVGRDAVNR